MKEIGGYFELEKLISNEYHKSLIALNSGRNALIYILKSREIEKLYIPYYLCESVYEILKKYNYKYEFYKIKGGFTPDFEKNLDENEYLYVVNYYGQLNNEILKKLKDKYKNIIVDNTHSFFQEPLKETDTIYNCRKWFGVSDGAYLSTEKILEIELEKDKSGERMKHLLGRFEETASKYYKYFQKNDETFQELELKQMSDLTHNILGAIDYENIKNKRKRNYKILENKFKEINGIELKEQEIPFCYPLYLENAVEIKKKLAEQKIYIPTLWPNVLEEVSRENIEYKYAKNILPVPCDQRYNEEDMKRIIELIDAFKEER